ncbi:hypothetical protein [Prevotella sp. KH2C16]|uniref:hypothetical protein n=1 Tax=Prevotella sp. KH2C16 TaxID=1855325 RepID=UPI0008E64CD5|nr:hypothetical protein [Prevotella sp. KH2C16]SFG42029.1 hypothetical protein SAMN05216383_11344 [Prevotella sp. KH2C16]
MKKDYTAPKTEQIEIHTERLMGPNSVTENGQTSPDMGIGGDSPGGQEADSKPGFFENEWTANNPWDD